MNGRDTTSTEKPEDQMSPLAWGPGLGRQISVIFGSENQWGLKLGALKISSLNSGDSRRVTGSRVPTIQNVKNHHDNLAQDGTEAAV